MEKLHYFLVYYSYSSNNGFGFGNMLVSTKNIIFKHSEIVDLVKKSDSTIKSVTLTGFNELTEEQYNIYSENK